MDQLTSGLGAVSCDVTHGLQRLEARAERAHEQPAFQDLINLNCWAVVAPPTPNVSLEDHSACPRSLTVHQLAVRTPRGQNRPVDGKAPSTTAMPDRDAANLALASTDSKVLGVEGPHSGLRLAGP